MNIDHVLSKLQDLLSKDLSLFVKMEKMIFFLQEHSPYIALMAFFRGGCKGCMERKLIPLLFTKMIDQSSTNCCNEMKSLFKTTTNMELTPSSLMTLLSESLDVFFTAVEGHSCLENLAATFFEDSWELKMKMMWL